MTLFREDPFLRSFLGKPCYTLDLGELREPGSLAKLLPAGPCFIATKVTEANPAIEEALVRAGFRFQEEAKIFSRAAGIISLPSQKVRLADSNDEDGVAAIARSSFIHSRFHADSHIPREAANGIKEAWVRNYFREKRGDALFVAESDGKISGFLLALLNRSTAEAVIDLIASGQEFRGMGVATSLISAFSRHYGDVDTFKVGTQATNIASRNLYESLGFRVSQTINVYHLHRD